MNHLNVNLIVDKSSNGGGGGGEERGAGDFEETECGWVVATKVYRGNVENWLLINWKWREIIRIIQRLMRD